MNKIRSTFKQERSDRSHLAGCKSVVKKGLYALALTGLSLPFANGALAISLGCSDWNLTSTNDGIAGTGSYNAWEVAKVTFTHQSGNSPNNYTFTYTDNNNAANSRAATPGSTIIGDTVTLTLL
ncbi:MAG: hypothetical protein CMO06_09520 [Thalassospira sp.]|uniref:hypothetical protein n=1 Tax=Thalassospira sp. TaxID=1912094 RepID=UPI000C42B19E|nr:hypothetical protein [Thalassospira sp.]MAZ33369.1 hypothetical protein [Thalassospira sp.]